MSFGLLLIPIYFYQKFTEIVITTHRVIGKKGIIRRETYEFGLDKIELIDVKQTVLGRIFGFGDIVITGSGNSNLTIYAISSPEKFKHQLNNWPYALSILWTKHRGVYCEADLCRTN